MPNNFSRSNVNEQMLQVSMPDMSSFNMSHSSTFTPRLGEITPFNYEPLLPRAVINGTNRPKLDLEKVLTPSIGRIRMDTHNFIVLAHRINRDWKFFKEGKLGYEQLPTFYPYTLMANIFAFLLNGGSLHVINDITPNSPIDSLYFRAVNNPQIKVMFGETAVFDSTVSSPSYQNFLRLLYWSVMDKYKSLYTFNSDSVGVGYFQDFFVQEAERMRQKFEYYSISDGTVVLPNFADVILDILQPYFGEGSILEQLGYPIFTQYSMLYENIYNLFKPYSPNGVSEGSVYSRNAESYLTTGITIFDLFKISGHDSEDDQLTYFTEKPKSEMALRAYYACWFDYFRNFHVEKRANILDPDTFDRTSIVGTNTNLYDTTEDRTFLRFLNLCAMILPHKRNFPRDYVTTVQVDDAYRYVYTPWLPDSDGNASASTDDTTEFYNNIQKLMINGSYFHFPTGDPNSTNSSSPYTTLVADLQTMRRSKMLERVLAREYYYPDTYAGRMLAHYGIKPGDIDTMNSVYLSGSEQFISGDQLKANIGTEETPQGTRTFIGGASSVDSYSYAAQDFAYLISTLSLVPMVSYDATNPHHDEIMAKDIPLPQFAADTRCIIRPSDLIRGFESQVTPLGYVPRYYSYRVHPDETHGKYLTDYRSYNFMRDWFNMTSPDISSLTEITSNPIDYLHRKDLSLNPYFLRVNVPLDAFLNLQNYDSVAFGKVDIECFISNPLPAAIEFI